MSVSLRYIVQIFVLDIIKYRNQNFFEVTLDFSEYERIQRHRDEDFGILTSSLNHIFGYSIT